MEQNKIPDAFINKIDAAQAYCSQSLKEGKSIACNSERYQAFIEGANWKEKQSPVGGWQDKTMLDAFYGGLMSEINNIDTDAIEWLDEYKKTNTLIPNTHIEKLLDEILNSVQSTTILDPFNAGIVSTVIIIKKELGFLQK